MTFTNAFIDLPKPPTKAQLADALGPSQTLWSDLLTRLSDQLGIETHEWHSYSRKAGWALRLKKGKRTIVYLAPERGGFRASFALGEKAVEAAIGSGLPAKIVETIDQAQRFAEGRAVRIDVKRKSDIAIVLKLAAAKLEN